MNCKTARQWISERVDGELPPVENTELEAHLKQCPSCTAWEERHRRAWDALGGYPAPAATSDFTEQVMNRLDFPVRATRRIWSPVSRWAYPTLAAAAVLILLLPLALYVKRQTALSNTVKRETPERPYRPSDRELIENLHLYENAGMLNRLELLSDLDILEAYDEPVS